MREPIDTVRRDGEFVILEDDVNGRYAIARWSDKTATWICADGAPCPIMPTHWHSLVQHPHRAGSREDIGSFRSVMVPPTDIRRTWQRRRIAVITGCLVAAVAVGWWLYRSEATNHVQMTLPTAARAADDIDEMSRREHAEAGGSNLAMAQRHLETRAVLSRDPSEEARQAHQAHQAQQAAERIVVELRETLQQERDKAETLTRDLAMARHEIANQTAKAQRTTDEAIQAKEAAERDATMVQEALQGERARADSLTRDLTKARREIEAQAAASDKPGEEAARLQLAVAELRQVLQQENDKAERLARELDTARRELETQAAALADKTTRSLQLTELQPQRPAPVTPQGLATTDTATKPVMPAGAKQLTMPAQARARAPDSLEVARLMERADLLRGQGDIGGARMVLEHAAEAGNAPALFALAETYDPMILSAWGTLGTRGDVTKARALYTKALAGGIEVARDRLNALP
jgi:hypothetical protein